MKRGRGVRRHRRNATEPGPAGAGHLDARPCRAGGVTRDAAGWARLGWAGLGPAGRRALRAPGAAGACAGPPARLTGILVSGPEVVCGWDYDEPNEGGEEVEEGVPTVIVLELLPRHGSPSSSSSSLFSPPAPRPRSAPWLPAPRPGVA